MIEYIKTIKEKTIIQPKTILEIGSRDGNDADSLRNGFNIETKNVWVVEPNPTQQEKILKTYPEINLIKHPIFNVEKNIIFYGVDESNQILNGVSSLLNRVDGFYETVNTKKIEMKTMLGSKLLEMINENVDLCKIDVEGATYEVLESFGNKIKNIKTMHIECEHSLVWENQKLYDDVHSLLIDNGFTRLYFEYCNNSTLQSDSIWVQNHLLK
jgi:FkbM family methyltransferase